VDTRFQAAEEIAFLFSSKTHSKTEKENTGNLSQNPPPLLLEVRVQTRNRSKVVTVESQINYGIGSSDVIDLKYNYDTSLGKGSRSGT
jgi:hypothetical protein